MITSYRPQNWRELQEETARILLECGLSVDVEKVVDTARGRVEIDVYAEETIDGRRYSIVCECKHWQSRVPQTVVHAVRTVVGDLGANQGLIVASSGFQSGTGPAADFTNVRLVSWSGLQAEFKETWLKRYLAPVIAEQCDPLLTFTEPFLPAWFGDLTDDKKEEYLKLKRQHDEFGWIMMRFTPYVRTLQAVPFPELPLRSHIAALSEETIIPDSVLDASAYRQFMEEALAHSDRIIAQFRALRPAGWTRR